MLRFATRLAHSRAAVITSPPLQRKSLSKIKDRKRWLLIPANARQNYADLIEKQKDLLSWSCANKTNTLNINGRDPSTAVITSGIGGNYYEENEKDFIVQRQGKIPSHLHIGTYPVPMESVGKLCENAEKIYIIEEGQPFIEEKLRGLLPIYSPSGKKREVFGKLDGTFIRTGELDPDNVRKGLGLADRECILNHGIELPELPGRPPQLCQGCSHRDSYEVLNRAVADLDGTEGNINTAICADIGCYSLGAGPPYNSIESIVCMGASVAMARGAAEAGMKYAITVIGDSTFMHSGITCLVDAIQAKAAMTVLILDNSAVAMTGCQDTIIPSEQLPDFIKGLGVDKEHIRVLEAHSKNFDENLECLKNEMEYRGLSVIIFRRVCVEAFRKQRRAERETK